MLWATPVRNSSLLFSKWLTTLGLLLVLIGIVFLLALAIQLVRGHTPIDLGAYARVYGLIVLPNAIFLTAVPLALNVMLRNKYLSYGVSMGAAVGLYYLYSLGYHGWLYNPLALRLWNYSDFANASALRTVLLHRIYVVSLALLCLSMALLVFGRKSKYSKT